MFRTELELGFFKYINRPGEHLGVLDNASDYDVCKERVNCNATHGKIQQNIVYDETSSSYKLEDKDYTAEVLRLDDLFLGRRHTIFTCGDSNNVYFPNFIRYKRDLPDALMRDENGNFLELHDIDIEEGEGVPMPAVDDPVLIKLNREAIKRVGTLLKDKQFVSAYVLGGEMLYPEYFGLGRGDFRPLSLKHFTEFLVRESLPKQDDVKAIAKTDYNPLFHSWYRFREQAMADRAVAYYQAILSEDNNRLIYYPTHGSTLCGRNRALLGQQVDSLVASSDGMEMGHIMVGSDLERRNVLLTSYFTSYGAPVIIPRLGNKHVDLSKVGGGSSFTPQTLRRYVYEALGLGISKIYPIHWRATLHDGEWFIKDTPAEIECARVFREIHTMGPLLSGMGRLQADIALFVSDATWIEGWNARWTTTLQDALAKQVHMTMVTDKLVAAKLAGKTSALISIDNYRVSATLLENMLEYLNAGGRLLIWGDFAVEAEYGDDISELRKLVLDHEHSGLSEADELGSRTVRELFLAGPEHGIGGQSFKTKPLELSDLLDEVKTLNPGIIGQVAIVESCMDLKDLNIYPLTDRSSLLYIVVNNGAKPLTFNLRSNPSLSESRSRLSRINPENNDLHTVDKAISLEAFQTMVFWEHPDVSPHEIEDAIDKASKAYAYWQAEEADISALRLHWSGMMASTLAVKRYCHARAILGSIVLKTAYELNGKGLRVTAEAFSKEGRVKGAKLNMRIIPGDYQYAAFRESDDQYDCLIPNDKLPQIYDHNEMSYKKLSGPARFIINAETDKYAGGIIVNASL